MRSSKKARQIVNKPSSRATTYSPGNTMIIIVILVFESKLKVIVLDASTADQLLNMTDTNMQNQLCVFHTQSSIEWNYTNYTTTALTIIHANLARNKLTALNDTTRLIYRRSIFSRWRLNSTTIATKPYRQISVFVTYRSGSCSFTLCCSNPCRVPGGLE